MVISTYNGSKLPRHPYTGAAWKYDIFYSSFLRVLSLWTLCRKSAWWVSCIPFSGVCFNYSKFMCWCLSTLVYNYRFLFLIVCLYWIVVLLLRVFQHLFLFSFVITIALQISLGFSWHHTGVLLWSLQRDAMRKHGLCCWPVSICLSCWHIVFTRLKISSNFLFGLVASSF